MRVNCGKRACKGEAEAFLYSASHAPMAVCGKHRAEGHAKGLHTEPFVREL